MRLECSLGSFFACLLIVHKQTSIRLKTPFMDEFISLTIFDQLCLSTAESIDRIEG